MIKLIGNELSLGDGTFYDLKRTSKERVLFGLKMQLEDGSITKEEYSQCIALLNSTKKCLRCSNENIKEEIKNLKEICKPVVEHLKNNYDPYYIVIITDSHIRLVRDEIGIPVGTAQEVPVQEQHKFIPEDSNGICSNGNSVKCSN